MIKHSRNIAVLIVAFTLFTSLIYSYYAYSQIKVPKKQAELFAKELISVVNQQKEFNMADVTQFDWDSMLVFGPYTTRKEMEEKTGHEWTTHTYIGYYAIQRTFLGKYPLDDDSLNKAVFMKGDQVVLSVTFHRRQVDLTQLNREIRREEAMFRVEGNVLRQHIEGQEHQAMQEIR